jgi:hypothetical protein
MSQPKTSRGISRRLGTGLGITSIVPLVMFGMLRRTWLGCLKVILCLGYNGSILRHLQLEMTNNHNFFLYIHIFRFHTRFS